MSAQQAAPRAPGDTVALALGPRDRRDGAIAEIYSGPHEWGPGSSGAERDPWYWCYVRGHPGHINPLSAGGHTGIPEGAMIIYADEMRER